MKDCAIRLLARLLIRCHLLKKMIVVRMDGGICSQMHFLLVGQQFKEKGYKVKFDIDWFETQGKDLTGKFDRNFDLLRAFPSLDFCVVKPWEKYFYSRLSVGSTTLESVNSPAYLGGYYANERNEYMEIFPKIFHVSLSVLDDENRHVYEEIKKHTNTVAIHVRRGDLATYNGVYGKPVDIDYFIKVLNKLQAKLGKLHCYIFSDEPNWVDKNMIHVLPEDNSYTLIDFNGSDRGYMDMFLISACKYQVTSKGSLGKFGGFLNRDVNGRIYVFDDEIERKNWDNVHDKIEFIS